MTSCMHSKFNVFIMSRKFTLKFTCQLRRYLHCRYRHRVVVRLKSESMKLHLAVISFHEFENNKLQSYDGR